ncbi:MAG: alanine racemase [Chitinophagales bacterium]
MDYPLNKWVEVNIEALEYNLTSIRGHMAEGVRLIAVIKSNAYGLGAVEVARNLAYQGVNFFAVTFLQEAVELRNNGIQQDILIFAPLSAEEAAIAIKLDCTLTVASMADLETVIKTTLQTGKEGRVHIKVDTGLSRFGACPEDAMALARLAKKEENIFLEGIYTHFSEAAGSGSFTVYQYNKFIKLISDLNEAGIFIPLQHCSSSSAFLRFPHMHLNAVRIGTLLGGQYPAGAIPRVLDLRDAFRFKARVAAVRYLSKGSYIGYYRTYRLKRDAQIAVIPVGFVDGLTVEPISKPSGLIDLFKVIAKTEAAYLNLNRVATVAKINGENVFIRGKVFMQFSLAEISPDMKVQIGDVVELPVKRTLASISIPRVYCRQDVALEDSNRPACISIKSASIL